MPVERTPTFRPYEDDVKHFTCEVCDKSADLTEAEAYEQNWDTMPWFNTHVTCEDCSIMDTAWGILLMSGQFNKK